MRWRPVGPRRWLWPVARAAVRYVVDGLIRHGEMLCGVPRPAPDDQDGPPGPPGRAALPGACPDGGAPGGETAASGWADDVPCRRADIPGPPGADPAAALSRWERRQWAKLTRQLQ